MRSITLKLLLAFLAISLVSVALIVLSARWMTEREFRSYLFDQNRNNIISTLENYYNAHGDWTGVEVALTVPVGAPPPRGIERSARFFTLTDATYHVVMAGPGDQVGGMLSPSEIADGMPIKVNGSVVGFFITRQPTIRVNPAETAFLTRIRRIYLLSAAGVIALALLLAFLLSRTLTRPIRDLTAATQAVSTGNLAHEVPVRSRDELGQLAASFNQMNADLRRSLELRRQMTADIAHELRTPISIILGHAEGVHDGVLAPSLETFEIVRDEAGRLDQLVDDLRTLSLADADELPIERQRVAPDTLLEDVKASHTHRAGQKNISLDLHIAPHLPEILVDPGRMMQVLNNLVDNALRYTPAGGRISLAAQMAGKELEMRVQDSGPGVAADDLERIFERFYRSDPSRQREEGGSGLGLAIARAIVEKHAGRIWAESKPGEGTTIVIHLPIAPE
jgi:signal transduction histidine kinase